MILYTTTAYIYTISSHTCIYVVTYIHIRSLLSSILYMNIHIYTIYTNTYTYTRIYSMLSLGVAIGFDYSLFLLNRFREELIENKYTRDFSVYSMLAASGHVVALSGLILLFTFILLITFPQKFLQSVGIACSVVVFSALISNLTLTPSLLLAYDCFMKFEALPTRQSLLCCCTGWNRNNSTNNTTNTNTATVIATNINHNNKDYTNTNKISNAYATGAGNGSGGSGDNYHILSIEKAKGEEEGKEYNNSNSSNIDNVAVKVDHSQHTNTTHTTSHTTTTGTVVLAGEGSGGASDLDTPNRSSHPTYSIIYRSSLNHFTGTNTNNTTTTTTATTTNNNNNSNNKTVIKGHYKSVFFAMASWVSEHPYFTLTLAVLITAPLLYQLTQIVSILY